MRLSINPTVHALIQGRFTIALTLSNTFETVLKASKTNEQDANTNQSEYNDNTFNSITMSNLIINPVHNSMTLPMEMITVENKNISHKLINTLVEIVTNCRPIHAKILHNYLSSDDVAIEHISKLCRLNQGKSNESADKSYNSLIRMNRNNNINNFMSQVSFSLCHLCKEINDDDSFFDGCQEISIKKINHSTSRHSRTRSAMIDSSLNDFDLIVDNDDYIENLIPEKDILIATFMNDVSVTAADAPLQISNNHKLLLIKVKLLNGNERTLSRWYDGYSWNIVEKSDGEIIKNYQSSTLILGGNVELAIYCKVKPSESYNHIVTQSLNNQKKAYCDKHGKWLIKVPIALKKPCVCKKFKNNTECGNQSQWRCPHGTHSIEDNQCDVSICTYCMKKIKEYEHIKLGAEGNEESYDAELNAWIDNLDNSSDDEGFETNEPLVMGLDDVYECATEENEINANEEESIIDAGQMMSEIDAIEDGAQMTSAANENYNHDPNLRIPSHFLFNNYLKVLTRKMSRNQSSKTSFLLNQIVSSSKSPSISLMFPESMLNPSLFFTSENNSAIGSIPNFGYSGSANLTGSNIASLGSHIFVRSRDGSLATSHSISYAHMLFDLQLNDKLNHNSSQLVYKRGFEHLVEKGVTGEEVTESNIEFDEQDSSRKVKELAAFMKYYPWNMFYTFTSSDATSPGLNKLNSAIKHACQD